LRKLIVNVAPSDATILLRGESGTGKDIVARIIHNVSGRSKLGDFVKINCPAIPETLLESEMFGHEAGSFTGAERRKPGRFEIAAGGTVFLDEIGDLPLSSQAKLLQVIEHKEFTRVGGTKTMRIDARIIAATNAPLEEMIAAGRFRADLFHRLNQFSINLPPLRDRISDIPQLVRRFLATGQGSYKDRPLSAELFRECWNTAAQECPN
jgi:transcriptional regulator with PAS, ATPase and Fis domain